MIALVDMDGTLCDYRKAVESELERLLGEPVNMHDDKYKALVDMIKKQDGFWRNLETIELGMTVVKLLQSAGFELHVLTKGPYRTTSAWTEKVEWCRERLPGVPVTITENKGIVYGRVLFDDWPPNCEAWLKYRPRGLVIMPAYPYNEGFDERYPGQVVRVSETNLGEVAQFIERAAKRNPGEPL